MSSVETAALPKASTKKRVLFNEEVRIRKVSTKDQVAIKDEAVIEDKKVSIKDEQVQKPLQVLNFMARSDLTNLLEDYFFSSDIGRPSILKDEVSADINSDQKFSQHTDVCIVFFRTNLPLSDFPNAEANLEKMQSSNPNLKIIKIEVESSDAFQQCIQKTIDEIEKGYTQIDENPEITALKKIFSARAKEILLAPESSAFQKKMAFKSLIKLYVAINACSDVAVLSCSDEYQNSLKEIEESFLTQKKALQRKSFGSLDMAELMEEEEKLDKIKQARKHMALCDLIEDINAQGSKILNLSEEISNAALVEDIKAAEKIIEQSAPVNIPEEDEKIVSEIIEHSTSVITLVEVELDVTEEVKEKEKEKEKEEEIRDTTSYWREKDSQQIQSFAIVVEQHLGCK